MDRSAFPVSHEAPPDLESSLQQLKLGDCAYFLRTGTCAFGSRCRYNHPTAEDLQLSLSRNNVESLPERPGQIECQFFIKTGVCKFGPACRFHHPRPSSGSQGTGQLQFNFLGLPLRPSEKDCAYYLQTGSCTYGSTCKLNHPQPTSAESIQQSLSTSINLSNGMSMPTPSAYQDQGNTWPGNGTCVVPSTVGMPIPFRTAVVTSSPQHIPGSGLNFHQQSGYDLKVPTADMYPRLCPPSGPPYPHSQEHFTAGIALARPTATILHGQTIFPERPGQPDCHHYMKTGDCKFGMNCKFHHPKDRAISLLSGLNPMGLPLRPGKQACPYYVKHGICKFGPVCKFDHPVKILPHSPPYSPSMSSLNEVPVAPFIPGSSSPVTLGSEMSERHQNSVGNDQATLKKPVSEQQT